MLRPGPGQGEADVLLVINGGLDDVEVSAPEPLAGAWPWERVWSSTWDAPEPPDDEPIDAAWTLEALSVEVLVAPR
jgi:glycogen operon protein